MKFKLLSISSIVAATMLVSGCIGKTASDDHIAEIVEKTLSDKPEIIIEALKVYREREVTKKTEQQKTTIQEKSETIFNDGFSLVLGNVDGDVSIAAFKDYRCGYCKKSWAAVQQLLSEDANIRFVFKELPVLGPQSEIASRFALAAGVQDKVKYAKFNNVLMQHRGPWDEKTLKEIAKKQGLDTEKLVKDAASEEVIKQILQNRQLAKDLAIGGTPAFVIGDTLIPGAVALEFLKKAVADQRAKKNEDKSVEKTEEEKSEN